jgi:crotonobetainyl-CoA:carnitine CoA-transferase CaiB-like acyl-CoA transferase
MQPTEVDVPPVQPKPGSTTAGAPSLAGVRVLDFTRVLSGPYLTQLLADLGAEVIKVESPEGDDTRAYLPPGLGDQSANFMGLNRLKKSVVLDLKSERDHARCVALARKSDVLVENFRPGTMDRLGLDYETLSALNEGLIYCSISGYGQEGAYSHLAGYDPIVQAETGFMFLTGDSSQPPTRAGGSLIDVLAGAHAGMGILSALHARSITGQGDRIDVSLYNTAMAAAAFVYQGVLITGENPPRLGNTSFFMCPNGLYDCADGQVMISAGNNRLFKRLCGVLEAPELLSDPRFETNRTRLQNVDALSAAMNAVLRQRPRDHWVPRLREAGVPAGAVRAPVEAVNSPETRASGLIQEIDHPFVGPMRAIGPAIRMARAGPSPVSAAPTLGQHTASVLAEILGE